MEAELQKRKPTTHGRQEKNGQSIAGTKEQLMSNESEITLDKIDSRYRSQSQ